MSDDVGAPDLTQFKVSILAVLADEADYGLGIKRDLEAYMGETINHGRLYPNLDDLVDEGLVEKSELDKRTNQYEITEAGWEVVHSRASWLGHMLGLSGNLDYHHRLANAEPEQQPDARTDGGDGDDRTLGEQMAEAAENAGLFDDDGGDD